MMRQRLQRLFSFLASFTSRYHGAGHCPAPWEEWRRGKSWKEMTQSERRQTLWMATAFFSVVACLCIPQFQLVPEISFACLYISIITAIISMVMAWIEGTKS